MEKEKFLGNKKIEGKGTGVACGCAVKEVVFQWKLRNNIKAINYDTCPINTGGYNGMKPTPLYLDLVLITRNGPVHSHHYSRSVFDRREGNGQTTDVVSVCPPHPGVDRGRNGAPTLANGRSERSTLGSRMNGQKSARRCLTSLKEEQRR